MSKRKDAQHAELVEKLADLQVAIKSAQAQRDKTEDLNRLKIEVNDLEISKSKIEEEFDRERREIEHKVGLEQKRQEQELALARREAKLEVGESNLEAERERFEKDMKFLTDRMTGEVDRVNGMFGEVLKRLPDISAALEIGAGRQAEREQEAPRDERKRKGS